MAFVTKKGSYYQLVRSRRVNGKPRQEVICYLGTSPTVEAAYQYWSAQAKGRVKINSKIDVVTIGGEVIHGNPDIHQMRAKQKVTILEEYRDPKTVEAENVQKEERTAKRLALESDPRRCGFWKEAVETLGFSQVAEYPIPTGDEIKSAYRDKIKSLHPDTNTTDLMNVKAAFEYVVDWTPAKKDIDWMTPAERWKMRNVWQAARA
jgi:hypothetical protein